MEDGKDEACTCLPGWEARMNGKVKRSNKRGYECCDIGTGGAVSDGTCYDHKTDDDGCTQQKCTSSAPQSGDNCWAGTEWQGCTCSDGWTAVETGKSGTLKGGGGKKYYEYTCCPSGGVTDGACGAFVPLYERWWFILVAVVISVLIILGIFFYCRRRKKRKECLAANEAPVNPPENGMPPGMSHEQEELVSGPGALPAYQPEALPIVDLTWSSQQPSAPPKEEELTTMGEEKEGEGYGYH